MKSFSFDAAGQLTVETDEMGDTTTYGYNNRHLVTAINYSAENTFATFAIFF